MAGLVVHGQFGDMRCYVSGDSSSTRAVLLVSDEFGYEAPNLRSVADKIAAAGFFVVVPDFLYGDYFDPTDECIPISVWRRNHPPSRLGLQASKNVVDTLKGRGITATAAAGFSWGAKIVVRLAKSDAIQAAVVLHPSFLTLEDMKDIKVNFAFLGAEHGHTSSPDLVNKFQDILSRNTQIDSFVKVFPGVAIGWSVCYNVNDEAAVRKAEEAHSDMINWFLKHVK